MTEPRRTAVELPPPSAAGKVLLVDDDFAILEAIADFLEEEGFSVVSASNGIDALNRMRSGLHVDVIVLDLMMPLMDGWSFRVEQLGDQALRDTPVVILSASRFTRDTIRRELNAYDALSKPLELTHFLETLKALCACRDSRPPPGVELNRSRSG